MNIVQKQCFILLSLLLPFPSCFAQPNPMRLLLASVRGGDYAHPGEQEIIDRVIAQFLQQEPDAKNKKSLMSDVDLEER